ncbi:MAG: OmpA family protein [Alphaproteobacteria bacterium]|nr:OmpA family protein [Alphaproteobacteria bacterium]
MALKKRHKKEEDLEQWLMTYADMITLLLCFFVILLSVSEPKQTKFEEMKKGMQSDFIKKQIESPFTSILQGFESIIENNHMQQDMSVEETEKGLILEFNSASFFKPGSADLRDPVRPILEQVAVLLKGFEYEKYKIEVEGHTDDDPISTPRYPSNWELSTGRAAMVVRFFIEQQVDVTKLKATGYADIHPKVPNRDVNGNPIPENQALNRRVAIRLERE